jgi:hypothetical protein
MQEGNNYAGGYLVTNSWGRPLEFRMSSAIQPNRVQQILYGWTLPAYICADVIGKTLIEKAGMSVQLLVIHQDLLLDLRPRTSIPLLKLAHPDDPAPPTETIVRPGQNGRAAIARHQRYPEDASLLSAILERIDPGFDLAEPFTRIREAMNEARKLNIARAA